MALYRLQDPSHGIIGPVGLDTVRDLAESGTLGADLLVSRDGGAFLPVRALDEVFAAVAPHLSQDERPTYAGDVRVLSFFKVFNRLHATRATGQLVVRDGVLHKEVFLEHGQPVFVVSSVIRERFGEFLLDRGRITREQLAAALVAVQQPGVSLGEALVEQGALGREAVLAELREQQLARLVDLCTWSTGCYRFTAGRRYLGKRVQLGPMLAETIVRAARVVSDTTVLLRLGPHAHRVPCPRSNQLVQACAVLFTDSERHAFEHIDGTRSVVELTRGGAGRRAYLSVLYLLWEIEAVDFRAGSGTT